MVPCACAHSKYMSFCLTCTQGLAKRQSSGLVNFVPALAYHFCMVLPEVFTQPGAHLLYIHISRVVRKDRNLKSQGLRLLHVMRIKIKVITKRGFHFAIPIPLHNATKSETYRNMSVGRFFTWPVKSKTIKESAIWLWQ